MMLMVASVSALSDSWSTRDTIGSDDIHTLFGERVIWANGRMNANFNGETGSGSAFAIVKLADESRQRISVNWNSRGSNDGLVVLADTPSVMVLKANARVIHNGKVSYGNQVYVVYFKSTDQLSVIGNGFRIGRFPLTTQAIPVIPLSL